MTLARPEPQYTPEQMREMSNELLVNELIAEASSDDRMISTDPPSMTVDLAKEVLRRLNK
jgi:hypothetical protein